MPTTNNQNRDRKLTTFTISEEAKEKLRERSRTTGISQSRIIEKLIEKMAEDPKLEAIVCKKIAIEDFEKWASSHNRQYVKNAKVSVFVPEAEREPERNMTIQENHTTTYIKMERPKNDQFGMEDEEFDKFLKNLELGPFAGNLK